MSASPTRVAIYCRVSSDERLGQEFNSIHAQREAGENYVRSHRAEGWIPLSDEYTDPGFSGGNTNRPGLQRLLADVDAGKIDCVIVYKLDRLSRSLRDFLNLLHVFERNGVTFVAVSQAFDTNTPIGKMTVNLLASFGEFERQIIAERTRDKMSAARRRGKWTGGMPPLGYDVVPEGGRLIVNRDEAEQVRAIFDLYVQRRSLVEVATELNRRGWRRKSWTTKDGRLRQGQAWDKTNLHKVLTDPIYAGLQKLRGETFPGQHPAIVPRKLLQQVQNVLRENRTTGGAATRNESGALLRSLLHCAACGRAMTATWTRRGLKRYRYYTCTRAAKNGVDHCPTRSVPAEEIERFVVDKIRAVGADPAMQTAVTAEARKQTVGERSALTAERRRLDAELRQAREDVQRLVAALAKTDGPAGDALVAGLETAQTRVATLQARLTEVQKRLDDSKEHEIDEADLRTALEAFDPVWDALLVPERERVLRLLIESVTYDGRTEELILHFHPLGVTTLAAEVAPRQEAI